MNKYILAMAVVTALGAAQSAGAAEYLNISVPQAHVNASNVSTCTYDVDAMGVYPASPAISGCTVEFPLSIPAGHTIHQISILESCSGVEGNCPGSAQVFKALRTLGVAGTASGTQEWKYQIKLPLAINQTNWVQADRMLGQIGSTFPDSFVLSAGKEYEVVVELFGQNAEVNGIQVVYD